MLFSVPTDVTAQHMWITSTLCAFIVYIWISFEILYTIYNKCKYQEYKITSMRKTNSVPKWYNSRKLDVIPAVSSVTTSIVTQATQTAVEEPKYVPQQKEGALFRHGSTPPPRQ